MGLRLDQRSATSFLTITLASLSLFAFALVLGKLIAENQLVDVQYRLYSNAKMCSASVES